MSECTTFCLILTVPSNFKTTVGNKVNIGVPEIGHLSTTGTFNNPLNYFNEPVLPKVLCARRNIFHYEKYAIVLIVARNMNFKFLFMQF